MTDNHIIKLSDRDHVLIRPNQYIGAITETEREDYFLNTSGKFEYGKIKYVPAVLKIISEILDNSIDEAIRTNFEFSNKIYVTINDDEVIVQDNGRGIPVIKEQNTQEYMPLLAFNHAKAGSNFEDDERATIGMNGVGAFCTNVFSKLFKAETSDGTNKLVLECKDNMSTINYKISASTMKGTKVSFKPDLGRFGLTKIDEVYKNLIKQRLSLLAISFPKIYFQFNGKKVGFPNNYNFISNFSEHSVILEKENYFIAVTPNAYDDFKFFSVVDGLYLKSGGSHVNIITQDVVNRLREKIQKTYKNIMPGDIKNKLQMIVFFKNFPNMMFDSQTKDNLTNSVEDIRKYMNLPEADLTNFVDRIYKRKEIIEPIIERYRIQEELKKRMEMKKTLSTAKVKLQKYTPPIGEYKYLVLCEGESASGGLMPVLGRKEFGYYELKGVSKNTWDISFTEVVKNEVFKNLIKILGIDITDKTTSTMTYDSVLIGSDNDLDGIHIRGLLLAFFTKFAPELVRQGKIKILNTPLIVSKNLDEYYFNLDDYNANKNEKTTYLYKKGLGGWDAEEELKIIFDREGVEKFIDTFQLDEEAMKYLNDWMSKSEKKINGDTKASDVRKDYIQKAQPFDIERA